MANTHFAEIGDVWKHLPLAEVLAIERPGRYWETHAGSALYPLTPSPQRDFGAYQLLAHANQAAALQRSTYVRLLRQLGSADPGEAIPARPTSPWPCSAPPSATTAWPTPTRQARRRHARHRSPTG